MENSLLIITQEGMGSAPHELQTVLVINFFRTLLRDNKVPKSIFFYAEGVKLNLRGSVIEDYLTELESRGTAIISCTTCLNYFEASSQLIAGIKGGMNDLIELISRSEKVVTI